jgi:hypothetical protein
LSHSTSPFFVKSFFKIGSLKLFAWADFNLGVLQRDQTSQSSKGLSESTYSVPIKDTVSFLL